MLVRLGQGPGNIRVVLGTLLVRVTIRENMPIKSRELWECYTDLQEDFCGWLEDLLCNDPRIGSYNDYHLRPNGIQEVTEGGMV